MLISEIAEAVQTANDRGFTALFYCNGGYYDIELPKRSDLFLEDLKVLCGKYEDEDKR